MNNHNHLHYHHTKNKFMCIYRYTPLTLSIISWIIFSFFPSLCYFFFREIVAYIIFMFYLAEQLWFMFSYDDFLFVGKTKEMLWNFDYKEMKNDSKKMVNYEILINIANQNLHPKSNTLYFKSFTNWLILKLYLITS